jgi:hypothetical protein
MFNTIRQWESLYECSKLESPNVCSTQTSDMKRPPLVKLLFIAKKNGNLSFFLVPLQL